MELPKKSQPIREHALERAWELAERAEALVDDDALDKAVATAAASEAWSSIAQVAVLTSTMRKAAATG